MSPAHPDLTAFKELVKNRCGLILDGLGEDPLAAAIRKRMAETGTGDARTYLSRLMGDEDEFQEFVTLMTVNETYFYREPEHLAFLVDKLVPTLLRERSRLPIRILSAGCATGEEPYSIAIALVERYGAEVARQVQIVGGDIDHHALAKARAARYTKFSFRALPPLLRQRYFLPDKGDSFVLDRRIADMVRFDRLNLLAPAFPEALRNFDVIFYRNVSIYFDEATRRAILETLSGAMTERAVMLTGSAESLANDLGILHLTERDGLFFFAKGAVAPRGRLLRTPPSPPAPMRTETIPSSPPFRPIEPSPVRPADPATPPEIDVGVIRELIRDKKYDRVLKILSARNGLRPPDAKILSLEGYVRLMSRQFDSAKDLAQQALRADEWSMEGLMLLGLVAKWQNRLDEAIRCFKQAAYSHIDCWPAYFYLGETYRANDATEDARRSYRVARQQLLGHPDADGGLLIPLGLPVAEVRFLCDRYTRTLPEAVEA